MYTPQSYKKSMKAQNLNHQIFITKRDFYGRNDTYL